VLALKVNGEPGTEAGGAASRTAREALQLRSPHSRFLILL
jgi:hypothetical protein